MHSSRELGSLLCPQHSGDMTVKAEVAQPASVDGFEPWRTSVTWSATGSDDCRLA